ncbi:hypothetical protein ACFFUB_09385 [Algimonas porphyrae]|uniref:DUF4760 domain-containing protein n=1 Tax=Algimonas porphyrae TaxID=1128113 RepID=A0ABQ5V2H8_9PROT|nr:hypothetical protein [Algimonas porphyrae]GLQ21673.1 hypothetical protein GCM10007854_26280 [Algimonas porphyrae]
MIFHRIKAHVENENWFAVFVDFLIVVVGVFLGIQIGNWNEARVSHVQEAQYLEQLRNEIAANAEMARMQATFVDRVVEGGRHGLIFLESDEPCQSDCEHLIIDLFHASQVWGTGFFSEKYQETNRRGIPTHEPLRLIVQDFYSYISGWDTVNATPPPFRERVRGYIPVDAMTELWSNCYEITDMANELLTFGCVEALSEIDLSTALSRMQADPELANSLRYWVSQNEYARLNYPTVISRSDASVEAINAHLGQTP